MKHALPAGKLQVPLPHCAQNVAPGFEKVPGTHDLQGWEPSEYSPAGHEAQYRADVVCVNSVVKPSALASTDLQEVQAVLPRSAENFPTGHTTHADCPWSLVAMPTGHSLQRDSPSVAVKLPGKYK